MFQYFLFALFATHILFIFVLKLTKIILKYDPPRLYQSKKAEWYVGAWIYHPNGVDKYRFRRKNGISVTGISRTERIKRGNALCNKILEQLKAGLINPWPELEAAAVEEKIPEITVSAALLEAYEIKKLRLKSTSANDYKSCLNIYITTLFKLGYAGKRLTDFKRRDAVHALEQIQVDRKFSDFRWNIYKERISSIMSVLVDPLEYIPVNPLHRVPQKKYVKGDRFKPATPEQQEKIDIHLYNHNRPLFLAMHIIQFAGVRPIEVLAIRRFDIDFERLTIAIGGKDVKTGNSKVVPITEELAILINEHLQNFIGNPYLFSFRLRPGIKRIHRNTLSNWWRIEVLSKETGLGLPVLLYSEKHYGTDAKILAEVSLEFLRQIYGHSSYRMTERYSSNLKQIANDAVRNKAPSILANIKKAK